MSVSPHAVVFSVRTVYNNNLTWTSCSLTAMFAETCHDDLGLSIDGDFDGAAETSARVKRHCSELVAFAIWNLELIIWKNLDFKVFISQHCHRTRKRR